MADVVVFGNVTLDVICQTVDEVPRYDSLSFDEVSVSPGGCGSNVAIGLAALGVPVALVARMGEDDTAGLLRRYWERLGIQLGYIRATKEYPTGVSIGLVDSKQQPRFIHTPGANKTLTAQDLDPQQYIQDGARSLHVAGYFVLHGILFPEFARKLNLARQVGLETSLDVVRTWTMGNPQPLWECLPHLDTFFCNAQEARILTGIEEPGLAAQEFHRRGAQRVVIKLGGGGCWLDSPQFQGQIPTQPVQALDTTGAGDAFAAGFVAARNQGADEIEACRSGNKAGSRVVQELGAVTAWVNKLDPATDEK